MTLIHTKSCPVCGNSNLLPFVVCVDNLVSKDKFQLLRCDKCNFGVTQDFPSEDEIGKYYEAAEYVSHSDTHKGIINRLYHIVRKVSLKSKTKLVIKSSGKSIGSLLDIGAGTGYFLNAVKSTGWSVKGIEKSESTRLQAKAKFGLDCLPSDSLFDLDEKSFDVITMWHVLEHVEKLDDTVTTLHKILKPDGVALIALPNKESFDARHYKGDWAAYDVPRHLWHFSIPDFTRLADKHGFVVTQVKPMYFDGFYISMLSEQNKGTALGALIGLIKGGFFFIGNLFNKKKSSSVIYILKKK